VLVQVVQVVVRTVVLLAVVPLKLLRARNRTAQRLLPMAQQAVYQLSAALAAAVAVVALPKLEAQVLATEVSAQMVESAEKAARELVTHCELDLQLCMALAVVAKEDG
jgi:hypothetical protein